MDESIAEIVPKDQPDKPSLGSGPEKLDLSQPRHQWVPTGAVLVHQTFIFGLDLPQVAEDRRGYAGSNKLISVERDSVGKEQLLEPLPLFG